MPNMRTRHVSERWGSLPLEEIALWVEGTPCLIIVKSVPSLDRQTRPDDLCNAEVLTGYWRGGAVVPRAQHR